MDKEILINRYIEYYRKTHPETQIKNMFDNINYSDLSSTNHILEMFYTDILKHNKIDNDIYADADLINSDKHSDKDQHELYGLKIDGNIKYLSKSVISLLLNVIEQKYTDWIIINLS